MFSWVNLLFRLGHFLIRTLFRSPEDLQHLATLEARAASLSAELAQLQQQLPAAVPAGQGEPEESEVETERSAGWSPERSGSVAPFFFLPLFFVSGGFNPFI